MTRFTPLWLQAGSYAASVDRRLIGALWPAAASSGCAVTFQSGTMLVNIAAGSVAVPAQNGSGSTLCTSDALEQVTIGAAPSAPNNRIDVVTCHPRGNDLDGGANTDFIFDVIVGAVAAAPVAPAVPAGQVALAQVYVPGGAASIVQANITDVRPFGLAVAGAGALPPPVTTGTNIQNFTDSSGLVWVAKNGVNGGAWRRARDVLHSRWWRSAALALNTTSQNINFDTMTRDPYLMYATGTWTIPVAGVYAVTGQVSAAASAVGQYVQINGLANGAIRASSTVNSATNSGTQAQINDRMFLNAGDLLTMFAATGAALGAQPGQFAIYGTVDYLGTG